MKVKDWLTGREIWSYYLNTIENLNGMNRIYTGSKGDYDMMGIYAEGFIDNVRLTSPAAVTPAPRGYQNTIHHNNPRKNTDTKMTTVVPTSYPTTTPSSPSSGILALAALGLLGSVRPFWKGKEITLFFKKVIWCF